MRVLKFIVDDTTIKEDPTCDFTGLFPGNTEPVRVEFTFSNDWKSKVKVAGFWSIMGTEYEPQVINDDGSCEIPVEVLSKLAFKIQVLGKQRGSGIKRTDLITVYQSGNKR